MIYRLRIYAGHQYSYHQVYYVFLFPRHRSIIDDSYLTWKPIRTALSPLFTPGRVRSMVPAMDQVTDYLVDYLGSVYLIWLTIIKFPFYSLYVLQIEDAH